VRGSVYLGADRQPVAPDGNVAVHLGDYETRWVMRTVGAGKTPGTMGDALVPVATAEQLGLDALDG